MVIEVLQKIPEKLRNTVREFTLDIPGNIELIAKRCFRQAVRVTDRFHVQKPATEALQEMRIKYPWEDLGAKNEGIDRAIKAKAPFQPEVLANRDTLKQLLARSKYVFIKEQKIFRPQL